MTGKPQLCCGAGIAIGYFNRLLRTPKNKGCIASMSSDLLTPLFNSFKFDQVYLVIVNIIRLAATHTSGMIVDFWMWMTGVIPRMVQKVADWFLDCFSEFACRRIDPSMWDEKWSSWMECERRLNPWWWWIKQLARDAYLPYIVVLIIVLLWTALFVFVLLILDEQASVRKQRWRRLRLLKAWIGGTRIVGWCFRPCQPGGDADGMVWTTDRSGITCTRGSNVETVQPLPVVNGRYLVCGLPFIVRATRQMYDVEYELTPCWLAFQVASGDELTGDYVLRREIHQNVNYVHVSAIGSNTTATLESKTWETIMSAIGASGKETTPYSVGTIYTRFHPTAKKDEVTLVQSTVADYWNSSQKRRRLYPQMALRTALQFVGDVRDNITSDWKITGRRILPDFAENPDAMPVKGRQSSLAAVHYRLDLFRNTMKEEHLPQILAWCSEFVEFVAPGLVAIEPWSLEQVVASQQRPLQKIRNEREKWWWRIVKPLKVAAMIKVEPVANGGPVRNISTCEVTFNLGLGRYMLAAAEYLKMSTHWYTAGKNPQDTAKRVCEVVGRARRNQGVREVCCADVSKMDAGKNPYLIAHLTTTIYARLFGASEEELKQLRLDEASATAHTAEGDAYSVGASQLSGSCTTTIDNTITNAFISYYAYRLEGIDPETAYNNLGAYVGDDSVSNNSATSVEEAGRQLGYVIKAEMISEHEPVPFLSRFFYDAWVGGLASVQDPVRLMRKIHISIAPPTYPVEQACVDKLKGLMELDKGVTLYRNLYRTATRLTGLIPRRNYDVSWMAEQVVASGGWPFDDRADEFWERYTGVSPKRYTTWLNKLNSFDELLMGAPVLIPNERQDKVKAAVDPFEPSAVVPVDVEEAPVHPDATILAMSEELDRRMSEITAATTRMINEQFEKVARNQDAAAREERAINAQREALRKCKNKGKNERSKATSTGGALFNIGTWDARGASSIC